MRTTVKKIAADLKKKGIPVLGVAGTPVGTDIPGVVKINGSVYLEVGKDYVQLYTRPTMVKNLDELVRLLDSTLKGL